MDRPMRLMGLLLGASLLGFVASPTSAEMKGGSLELGPAMPSGDGVTDNYGPVWLNLQAGYRLAGSESTEHVLTLGISGMGKSRTFEVARPSGAPMPKADYFARLFSFGYTFKYRPFRPLYLGGGGGYYLVGTEAKYDAGEGYQWTATGEREIKLTTSKGVFAPHVVAGVQLSDRFGIEARYTFIKTILAGNTSQYYYLTAVPDSELTGLASLSGSFRF